MVRLGIGILSASEDQLQILSGVWIAARLVQRYDAVGQAREPELDYVTLLYLDGKGADPGVGGKPPFGAQITMLSARAGPGASKPAPSKPNDSNTALSDVRMVSSCEYFTWRRAPVSQQMTENAYCVAGVGFHTSNGAMRPVSSCFSMWQWNT